MSDTLFYTMCESKVVEKNYFTFEVAVQPIKNLPR